VSFYDVDAFLSDSILPPPPEGEPLPILHDREYRVRAYRLADDRILIQGAIRDQKPPGLYLRIDPEPLTVHHMQVSIEVAFPRLEIVATHVHFEQHPNDDCPHISEHYGHLVGLSIARGFTHRVRELFGGPRGCTHTTALLQAMAPVAMQCFWSMRSVEAVLRGDPDPLVAERRGGDQLWRSIIDTCHVWAADGSLVAAHEAQDPQPVPVFMRARLAKLGIEVPKVE
jgi:hypothetical protein